VGYNTRHPAGLFSKSNRKDSPREDEDLSAGRRPRLSAVCAPLGQRPLAADRRL